jgi:ABC-type lipoprotein release transport system permease subunit
VRRFSSLAWRSLRARPLRSFLTAAGIALGVAVLYASLSAGATMDAAVDRAAADEIGHAALRVEALEERGFTPQAVQAISHVAGERSRLRRWSAGPISPPIPTRAPSGQFARL